MATEAELRAMFPAAGELPNGWTLDGTWWSASHGQDQRRVHLNGGGTDDELRFLVFPPGRETWERRKDLWPDCDTCSGTGRVRRPAMQASPFFSSLLLEGREFDEADGDGLRRCISLNCHDGRTEPIYGASNSRCRVPGFPADLQKKTGARGMSHPTKAETLRVMAWCDEVFRQICGRKAGERYP